MKHLSALVLFLSIVYTSYSQEALYPVVNYTTKDYGRDFHPSNMAIVQDHRGVIYAANSFKLLEFDGSGWKSYPISRETWILSLAVGRDGFIYIGSQSEFGFFSPDSRGELKYHSLSDSLYQDDTGFTNIWSVHTLSDCVVFQAEERIFVFREGVIKTINPETSFHTSFAVKDRLFVRERGKGLEELRNDSLIRVAEVTLFDSAGVFFMLPFGKSGEDILIGTREKGLWILDSDSRQYRKFPVEDDKMLSEAVVTGGTIAGDGSIAVSTMYNGVIIIDTTGKTRTIINTSKGLNDNDVRQIMSDQSENLWVALNNGISMIGVSSPVSVFNDKSGITGSINKIIRYENILYAGTTTGLFMADKNKLSELPFRQIKGISSPVRSLVNANGLLIAGSDAGIYKITGNTVSRIDSFESYILYYYPEMNILLSGGPKGLRAYRKDGKFIKEGSFIVEGEDIIGIEKGKNVNDEIAELWLGTRYNGVIRLRLKSDYSFMSDSYNTADGLPDGPVIPYSTGYGIIFGTIQGMFGFIDENVVKESLPDSLKNNKDFTKGYFSAEEGRFSEKGKPVSFLAEGKDKTWICSDNKIGYFERHDSLNLKDRPFRGIDAGKVNFIYPEESGICWIGATEGLIRYDEYIAKDYDQAYSSLIRKVTLIDADSLIFLGAAVQDTELKKPLDYHNNSLRFDFSASYYEDPGKTLFSYMLEGRSSTWSQWSRGNYQEFTNLREGRYTFRVKSRNIYGTESNQSSFSITILPPWYRSLPALIAYLIIAFILLWLSARLYSYRLKRENIRLEGIITERTTEIVRQKDEIVHKNNILELQKKEIEDSIKYARRIQYAVIPTEKACHEIYPESFVFFRPLNIVSGDFYWISRVENKVIYTAADCTGHGVPGAFMSMLGVAFLNEIVNKDKIISPDLILNNLRDKVIKALQQQGLSGETRDGMDIALVCIDLEEGSLEYAGAYNPLIMIRNGELFETRGEKMPIGYYENMRPFPKHKVKIERGDMLYMYSDGYVDQFGGPEGKKFKSKRLKNLLLEICNQSMDQQKDMIEKNFLEWKGDIPQIDDVVVVGIAIN
ncbi:MAG TPA: SpoIIE family protein phosphatase [Bacteroidales bacterium]|nr:SpoIIE family protein phosphatase [Bacteroidales bacterium]